MELQGKTIVVTDATQGRGKNWEQIVVSLTYRATVDMPDRFRKSKFMQDQIR